MCKECKKVDVGFKSGQLIIATKQNCYGDRSHTSEPVKFICACKYHAKYQIELFNGRWTDRIVTREAFDTWEHVAYKCGDTSECSCCCSCCKS